MFFWPPPTPPPPPPFRPFSLNPFYILFPAPVCLSLSPPAGNFPQSRPCCSRPCRRSPRSTNVCLWRMKSSCGSCTTATRAARAASRQPRPSTHPETLLPFPQLPSPQDNPWHQPQPWAPKASKDSTTSPGHLTPPYSLKLSRLELSQKNTTNRSWTDFCDAVHISSHCTVSERL